MRPSSSFLVYGKEGKSGDENAISKDWSIEAKRLANGTCCLPIHGDCEQAPVESRDKDIIRSVVLLMRNNVTERQRVYLHLSSCGALDLLFGELEVLVLELLLGSLGRIDVLFGHVAVQVELVFEKLAFHHVA